MEQLIEKKHELNNKNTDNCDAGAKVRQIFNLCIL